MLLSLSKGFHGICFCITFLGKTNEISVTEICGSIRKASGCRFLLCFWRKKYSVDLCNLKRYFVIQFEDYYKGKYFIFQL